jgi:hypothetical protein
MCLIKDTMSFLSKRGKREMFKSKWVLILALLVVVFVGLTMVTFALDFGSLSLTQGYDLMGHVCTSVCTI